MRCRYYTFAKLRFYKKNKFGSKYPIIKEYESGYLNSQHSLCNKISLFRCLDDYSLNTFEYFIWQLEVKWLNFVTFIINLWNFRESLIFFVSAKVEISTYFIVNILKRDCQILNLENVYFQILVLKVYFSSEINKHFPLYDIMNFIWIFVYSSQSF